MTLTHLSATTRARWRAGSWVATPTGQVSLWQLCDWMQREHEAARRVAPVGAERHGAGDVEARNDLAGGADLDAVSRIDADQRVVHEVEALPQRHAEVVEKFERSGPVPPSLPSTTMKSG